MQLVLETLTKEELLDKYRKLESRAEIQNKEIEELSKENSIFKELFEYSPTSMWEEDITDLVEYMNKLKGQGIKDFTNYFEVNPDELFNCIKKIKLINVNKATVNLHHADSKETLLNNLDKLFTPKSIAAFKDEIIAIAEGEREYETNTNAITFTGDVIDLRLYLKVIERAEEKKTKYFALVSTVDITELTKTESARRKSEQSLKAILNASTDTIMLMDEDGKIIEVNDSLLQLLNARKVDLIGTNLKRYYGNDNHNKRVDAIREIIATKKPVYYEEEAFNRIWETSCYPVFDDEEVVSRVAVYQKDITLKIRAEQRIKKNEERLELVLKAARLGWWDHNLINDQVDRSPYWYEMLGYDMSAGDRSFDFYFSLVHDSDKVRLREYFENFKHGAEENYTIEHRMRAQNGEFRWIYSWGKIAEWDTNGKPKRVVGVNMDISERKTAEKNEQMLLNSYTGIFNNSIDAIYILDGAGKFITVNDSSTKMYGYPKEYFVGKTPEFLSADGKNDMSLVFDYLTRAFNGESIEFDFWGLRSNGEEFPKIVRLSSVEYMGEKAVVAFGLDITDRYKAEEELKKSEERYRTIFNQVPLSITQVDHNGEIEKVNEFHLKKIAKGRRTANDFVGTNILKRESIIKANVIDYYRSLLLGKSFELSEVYFPTTTGGESAYFNLRGVPLLSKDKLIGAIVTTEDVTDYVVNRKKLVEIETRLGLALEGAAIGFWDYDLRTDKVWRSNQWFEMLGYRREQFDDTLKIWHELIHPDDIEIANKNLNQHESGLTNEMKFEHRLKNSKGEYQWILNWGKIIEKDNSGKPIRAAGIHLDINERKKAELELLESEQKYSSLVEQSNEGIIINQDWKIKYCNQYVPKMLGYSMEEIIDASIDKFLPPEMVEDIRARYKSRLSGNTTNNLYESIALTKDGQKIPIEVNTAVMEYNGKPAIQSILRIITERKKAEAALRESEERFKQLFNSMGSGVSIYEPVMDENDFILIAINKAGKELRGLLEKEVIGQKITRIFPEIKTNGLLQSILKVRETGKPAKFPLKQIKDNTIQKWIDNYIYKLPSGQMVVIYDDRSAEKKALEALKSSEEKLRNLYRYMDDIIEEERKKIAREVHDNLGQKLTALNLDVSWINQNIPDELGQIKENFVPVLDLINQSIVTVQEISTQLRPGILDDLGLANAIQWHSNETSRRSDLKFKLNLTDNDGNLSDIIKTQLYRVFQEALTNILRHAEAKNVEVNLKLHKNKLIFEIIDDGIGTTEENVDNINSLGIIGMKERVATINGKIKFITKPNKGTKIKIVIPV